MLVPLQGTRCRVLLEGAAIRGVCALEQACWCRCEVQLQGAAWGCCCQSGVRALQHAGTTAGRPLQAAWRCCCHWQVLLCKLPCSPSAVRARWCAAARYRCRVLLKGAAARAVHAAAGGRCSQSSVCALGYAGALRGAAWGCCCQSGATYWNGHAGASAGRCWMVLLCMLWSGHAGAAATEWCLQWHMRCGGQLGCCYRVLLSECGVRYEACMLVSLQGVAARSLPKNIFCYLEPMLA